jgi:peptidoglycan/LPS O-acetylase OafA/YrhL
MRITKLDGLRGVFCLMVVLYHYDVRILPEQISSSFIIRQSWIFVDFFFVLSGYVICYNYNSKSNKKQLKSYLIKRFTRLYPLLFFSTIVILSFEVVMNLYFPFYINIPKTLNYLLYQTLDTLTFMNSTPIFGSTLGMNYPSWSISSEMISYIVFGVIIVFFRGINQIRLFISLILISCIFLLNKELFFGYDFAFIRGFLSFSLGVLIYKYPLKKIRLPNYTEIFIPVLIVISLYLLNSGVGFLIEFHKIFTVNIVFFISIHILLKTQGFLSKLLDTSFFQFLGKISYSVYLNHVLIITIIPRGIFSIIGLEKNFTNMLVVLFLSLGFLIIYSKFTFHHIELNGGKYFRRKLL